MGTDVVGVHLLVETGLLQLAVDLGGDAGEDDVGALFMLHLDEVGEVVDAGRVDEGHLAHTDNLHAGLAAV